MTRKSSLNQRKTMTKSVELRKIQVIFKIRVVHCFINEAKHDYRFDL